MRSQVFDSYRNICEIENVANYGENASVAIIDSEYKPRTAFAESRDIGYCSDIINHPDDEATTGHGPTVANILSVFSDNIEFNFYRVVQSSGEIHQRHLLKAMGKAHLNHQVDVINLSLGYDHSHGGIKCDMPNEPCKTREAAKRAIDDGITVVAAAGNDNESDQYKPDEDICCPALLDEVISVSGMFAACTAQPQESTASPTIQQPQPTPPPLSCWVSKDDEVPGAYICTGLGCSMSPGSGCEDHRVVVEWGGNVDCDPADIDVLAPAEFPTRSDSGDPTVAGGTSYAAPIVTAVVAEAVILLKYGGETPNPDQIRSAIRHANEPLEDGDLGYLNGRRTLDEIAERNEITTENPESSTRDPFRER